ncbi:MAG: cytochrome P450 [Sphingomonadales bacterium]|nr:cytochrome P450 [Sphingomonadales bacterium]
MTANTVPDSAQCPVHRPGRDDRKSAGVAAAHFAPTPGSTLVDGFHAARDILRSPKVRQAGASTEHVDKSRPDEISFFFLDGDLHRKRRAAVAGLFAPKTIVTRHRAVMDRTMDAIVARLRASGSHALDELSWQMAVDVAAEIVGLTDSNSNDGLARRVKAVLETSVNAPTKGLGKWIALARTLKRIGTFWNKDMVPAIAARKLAPRDDVISHMVQAGFSKKGMIMETLSYAGAGMMTTREFIVMVAWHLFDNDGLRQRFLAGDEADQFAILEEILRLEPVASFNWRRAAEPIDEASTGPVAAGELLTISIRHANTDEAITGPCPFELDPDRAKRMKVNGPYLSFGDGPHRCPGAQVALHETRVFIDRLFRLPGIRLVSPPEIQWNPGIHGYELRGAIVACDPA